MKKILVLLLLPIISFTLSGCFKKPTEKMIEKQTGNQVKVDADSDSAQVSITDETTGDKMEINTEGGLDLPEGWPEEIKLYDGKVVSSVSTEDGSSVMIQTQDQASEVAAWYDDEMENLGWERVAAMDIAGNIMRSYEKGSQGFTLTLGEAEGTVNINHTYVAEY